MSARRREVTLIGRAARAPDIVIMGSHCVALDAVIGHLAAQGFAARTVAVGSMGGVTAVGARRMRSSRRSICSIPRPGSTTAT